MSNDINVELSSEECSSIFGGFSANLDKWKSSIDTNSGSTSDMFGKQLSFEAEYTPVY